MLRGSLMIPNHPALYHVETHGPNREDRWHLQASCRISWKAKKQCEHNKNMLQLLHTKDNDLYDMEEDSKNTAQYMLLISTSNFSLDVGKKEKVLSCSSLWTSIWCTAYCLLFGWPASTSLNDRLLSKVRCMHIWWRLWVSTKILSLTTAWCSPYYDLCLSVVLFFYCNWYWVFSSHLVNCLLPQKCLKFKFYITVLMFYKWCTSCLCIICSTLVIKAQSLNFIIIIWISVWRKSVFGVLLIISSAHFRLRKRLLIVIVHSVAYILSCFHSDLKYLLCVLRELHADSPVGDLLNILTALSSLWDDENSGQGLVPFIVFSTESVSSTPVFAWPWP